jgi:hypothetical protein
LHGFLQPFSVLRSVFRLKMEKEGNDCSTGNTDTQDVCAPSSKPYLCSFLGNMHFPVVFCLLQQAAYNG